MSVSRPDDWKAATLITVRRIRKVFDLDPVLKQNEKDDLYRQAAVMTAQMGTTGSQYWGVFVNCLRTLVAGRTGATLDEKRLFEE